MGETGREPFSYYDSDIGWKVIFCDNPIGFAFDTEEAAIKYVEDKNESSNAWASASIKKAVNAGLEEAANVLVAVQGQYRSQMPAHVLVRTALQSARSSILKLKED